MLSQALRGSFSSLSHPLSSSGASHGVLETASSLAESHQLYNGSDQDCLDTPTCVDKHPCEDADDGEPFWEETEAPQHHAVDRSPFQSIDDLCRSLVTNSMTSRMPPTGVAFGSSTSLSSASGSGSGMIDNSGAALHSMMARSCPKPIVMPHRGRQGRHPNAHQDELSVFVPPHELAASSLLDPAHVTDSLCRKGSAAIRLRAGVLRRTGFLEGQTEVLRPSGSVTALKP